MAQPEPITHSQTERPPVNAFTLILGSILAMTSTVAGGYSRYVLGSGKLDDSHLSIIAVAPLFLIAVFLARPLRISRGEMLVLFSMSLIGATMPTYFIGRFMAWIALPHYGATAENQWATYYEDHLPSFAIVQPGRALDWYYEGLPAGASIPWGHWIEPLFWWGTVVAAFYCCCLCLTVIFRKQWVEHERIRYPLMELPLALTDTDRDARFHVCVMNNPLFWAGFGIAFGVVAWNAVGRFTTGWPNIEYTVGNIELGRVFKPIAIKMDPLVLGFTYFVNQDITFSLWFFNFVANLEVGLINRFGLEVTHPMVYGNNLSILMGAQAQGAFTAIILFAFWNGRKHIRDVIRKALGRAPDIDDSDELMSYRSALFGVLLGAIYLAVWLRALGMPLPYIPVFLFGVLTLFLGITRVISESGLVTIRAPMSPQDFAMFSLGTSDLSNRGILGIALSIVWVGDTKTTIMPALANSTKLYSSVRSDQRRYLWPVLLAMTCGVLATFAATLYIRYTYGGLETGGTSQALWNHFVTKAKNRHDVVWTSTTFIAIGTAFTALLMALRYRFPLLPFHPIGFAAGPVYPVNGVVMSIFATWLIKVALRRFGGGRRVETAKPFFVGLIVGHFIGAFGNLMIIVIEFLIYGNRLTHGL